MKEWFSAQELADLKLPALPTAKKNILASAARENWKSRAREGRGGGKEYHISALPEVARIQLAVMTAPAAKKEAVKTEINPQGLAEYAHIEGRAKSRIDAKLEILEAFKEFQKSLGFANTRARYIFAEKYNAGEVRRIADERCLDVLLAKPAGKDGIRVVSKKGIAYEGSYYNAPELGGHEGEQVRLLLDEQDYGELYAFDLDGKFICKVISPENKGVSLKEIAVARSVVQKRAITVKKEAWRKIAKDADLKGNALVREVFMQAAEEAGKLERLPTQTVAYQTEQMAEAVKAAISHEPPKPTELSAAEKAAAERLKAQKQPAKVVKMPPSPQQNLERWQKTKARFEAGEALTDDELFFFENYPTTAEYKAQVFAAKCPKVIAGAM